MPERTRAPERRLTAKRQREAAERSLAARIRHQIRAEERASRKRDNRAQALRDEGRYSDAARTQANADTHRSRVAVLRLVLEEPTSISSEVLDVAEARGAIAELSPKAGLGPHSQFVKGYNRAVRDVLAALDTAAPKPDTAALTIQGGDTNGKEEQEEGTAVHH